MRETPNPKRFTGCGDYLKGSVLSFGLRSDAFRNPKPSILSPISGSILRVKVSGFRVFIGF